jgi:hypothetical protein
MQRAVLLLVAATLAVPARPILGQEMGDTTPTVTRLVVATGVQDREPVGAAEQFSTDVGTLYCFMSVEGHFAGAQLYQVWMHGDQEMARVPLTVKGPRWRTWSTKTILPSWTGAWSVKVEDAQGTVLKSVDFTVGGAG